jgi:hypothetical protein
MISTSDHPSVALGLVLFAGALWLVRRAFRDVHYTTW